VFRDDNLATAAQNEQLQREVAQLRAENAAMRHALTAYRIDLAHAYAQRSVYESNGFGLSEGDRVALAKHDLKRFPVWAAVTLHLVTFGLWSLVHFGRMHGRLPKLRPDDPTTARAIGMFFVPYVNIWWSFFSPMRLIDRLNLQFVLRGREAPLTKLPIVAGAVMSFFMYFLPVGWVFAVYKTQKAVNELVEMGDLDVANTASATGVRVDTEHLFGEVPAEDFDGVEAVTETARANTAAG
jgi:hypothetical protein